MASRSRTAAPKDLPVSNRSPSRLSVTLPGTAGSNCTNLRGTELHGEYCEAICTVLEDSVDDFLLGRVLFAVGLLSRQHRVLEAMSSTAGSQAAYVFKRSPSGNDHAYLKHQAYKDSFFGTSVAADAESLAVVVGPPWPELPVPGRSGAAVISPVSPPLFNSDLQLPPTLPPGRGVTNF